MAMKRQNGPAMLKASNNVVLCLRALPTVIGGCWVTRGPGLVAFGRSLPRISQARAETKAMAPYMVNGALQESAATMGTVANRAMALPTLVALIFNPFTRGNSFVLNHCVTIPPAMGKVIAVPTANRNLVIRKRAKFEQSGVRTPAARRNAPMAKTLFIPIFAARTPAGMAKAAITIATIDTDQLTVPLLTPYSCIIEGINGPAATHISPTPVSTKKSRASVTNL